MNFLDVYKCSICGREETRPGGNMVMDFYNKCPCGGFMRFKDQILMLHTDKVKSEVKR